MVVEYIEDEDREMPFALNPRPPSALNSPAGTDGREFRCLWPWRRRPNAIVFGDWRTVTVTHEV